MKHLRATTIALLFVAFPAAAEQLQFSLNSETEYDTDVTSQRQDDVIFRFGPEVEISGEHSRFDYIFTHSSEFTAHGQTEALNDWRHRTSLRGNVRLHPRLSMTITENLSVLPSAGQSRAEEEIGTESLIEPETDPFRRDEVLTNVFRTSLTGTLNPRLLAIFDLSHFFREFDNPAVSQQSTESITLTEQVLYQLNSSHSFGAGFRFRRRLFETSDSGGENSTDIYDVFGIWRWDISERTQFSFQAGPAFSEDDPQETLPLDKWGFVPGDPTRLIDPRTCDLRFQSTINGMLRRFAIQDGSCEAFDQQAFDEDQLQYLEDQPLQIVPSIGTAKPKPTTNIDPFFSISLNHQLDRGALFASYTRSDSESQGLGSATTVDVFRVGARYEPVRRWVAAVSFTFNRRTTDLEQELVFPILEIVGPLIDGPAVGLSASPVVGSLLREGLIFQETDNYNMRFSLTHQLGRRTSVFFNTTLRRQDFLTEVEIDGSSGGITERRRDGYEFRLGFNYRFQPIRL